MSYLVRVDYKCKYLNFVEAYLVGSSFSVSSMKTTYLVNEIIKLALR